jgi:hypothetical protein
MKFFICTLVLVNCFIYLNAQINEGGLPRSALKGYSIFKNEQLKSTNQNKGVIFIEGVNKDLLREEARTHNINRSGYNYGKEVNANVNFFSDALKIPTNDGYLYILNIQSDAEGYQFIFDEFKLTDGCDLFIYNDNKNMTLGAFTYINNRSDERFVTQFITGGNVYIELFIPTGANNGLKFNLDKVVFIYDGIFSTRDLSIPNFGGSSENCHINTSCYAGGYSNQIKSVVTLFYPAEDGNWSVGSGVLVNKSNNYADSQQPFLLTAIHVIESKRIKDFIILYRYEGDWCYDSGIGKINSTNSSAGISEIVSSEEKLDVALLKISNTVGEIRDYNISFAGWDTRQLFHVNFSYGIHHPGGDIKKISFSYNPLELHHFNSSECPDPFNENKDYIKVVWSDGVTAKGSSGSPLFSASGYVIGVLSGGFSYCETPTNIEEPCGIEGPLGPDFYGSLQRFNSEFKLSKHLGTSIYTSWVDSYSPVLEPPPAIKCDREVVYNSSYDIRNKQIDGFGTVTINPLSQVILESNMWSYIEAYDKIILKPGFHVKSGASFIAKIAECPTSSGIFKSKTIDELTPANEHNTIEEQDDSSISIFPNPTSSLLNIVSENDAIRSMTIFIYDNTGILISSHHFDKKIALIDIGNQKPGIYILEVIVDDHSYFHKIIKK